MAYLGLSRSFSRQKGSSPTPFFAPKSGDIMGEVKTHIRQIEPDKANLSHDENTEKESVTFAAETPERYSAKIKNDEFDAVFSNTPMDIDVVAEYSNDEELESIACYTGAENFSTSGVGFDEMENLAKVIGEKEQQPERIAQAATTVRKVENTDLFEAVISGYENGLQKVAEMLAKHETAMPTPVLTIENYEDFELHNFL
ncbi:MAG: hypothetical protein RSF40_10450 [Oscillospiraceae bacterium]